MGRYISTCRENEEKQDRQEKSLLGHTAVPPFPKQGQGPFHGVSPRQAEPGRVQSPLPGSFPAATQRAQGSYLSSRPAEPSVSAPLRLCLTPLTTWMDCAAIKKTRGRCQPGGAFSPPGCKRRKMQTTSEARMWECELYQPRGRAGPAPAPKSLQRREEPSPTLSTTAEKAGSKACFHWSKPSFHACTHFCRARAWQTSSSLPGRHFQHSRSLCSPHTHAQIPTR